MTDVTLYCVYKKSRGIIENFLPINQEIVLFQENKRIYYISEERSFLLKRSTVRFCTVYQMCFIFPN